jgi:hypothetical protein
VNINEKESSHGKHNMNKALKAVAKEEALGMQQICSK